MQYVFNVISLLGGLAMFLYGMRLMGNNLKEGSSGTMKVVMSKATDSYIKAFLLGIIRFIFKILSTLNSSPSRTYRGRSAYHVFQVFKIRQTGRYRSRIRYTLFRPA